MPAFRAHRVSARQLQEAITSPLLATVRDGEGNLIATTGVQTAAVLDDIFARAAHEQLGPSWTDDAPTLAVWAPTARSVTVKLYEGATTEKHCLVGMKRNDDTGVWSVAGAPGWRGRYYAYLVTVYVPSIGAVVTNEVTDPYSLSLSADSVRSQLVDLNDPALAPPGWATLRKPPAVRQDQATIYELHVRDFSASDPTVPERLRGTYSAFTVMESAGMRSLRGLATDGLTHVQLMPVFDFATVPERRSDQLQPECDLGSLAPESERQQEIIGRIKDRDSQNWGYAPIQFSVPEGSYATVPDGPTRCTELRSMIAALNEIGLRVVLDVAYNHTAAAGQDADSVLDRIVPGYYQRLRDDGSQATGTGCLDTAPEHMMMAKLVVDSVVIWAEQYKVDGFRFDLMGSHPKENLLAVRGALDALETVDGKAILLYGEGWNIGEVGNDARFVQATRRNMAATGIGTFDDQIRDAVRGGHVSDADPRRQGFASGLFTSSNRARVNGSRKTQLARLLHDQATIKVGLTGSLSCFPLAQSSRDGPFGYNAEPCEAITYVDCHDDHTLFDALVYKLPAETSMADRVRMQSLALAIALLSQGAAFVLAGSERLRSKSLDRNSYNSGDWFNRLLWNCEDGNGFAGGLPPASENRRHWRYARPLLANRALRPDCEAITAARSQFSEFLRIRRSSPAFSIGATAEIRRRISFPEHDGARTAGVIAMHIDTTDLDPRWAAVIVIFNATPDACTHAVGRRIGGPVELHPVQAASHDPIVRQSAFNSRERTLTVPGRTVAVFTELGAPKARA